MALNVWSRSPNSNGYNAYNVNNNGNVNNNNVWNTNAFRPALTLKSGILVSDVPMLDGKSGLKGYVLAIEETAAIASGQFSAITEGKLSIKLNGNWYKIKGHE